VAATPPPGVAAGQGCTPIRYDVCLTFVGRCHLATACTLLKRNLMCIVRAANATQTPVLPEMLAQKTAPRRQSGGCLAGDAWWALYRRTPSLADTDKGFKRDGGEGRSLASPTNT
jgi:hypothetical protein